MAAITLGLYKLIYALFPHNTIVVIFVIPVAVVVYFAMYFILRGATKEEVYEFPMGVRIVRLASRFGVM